LGYYEGVVDGKRGPLTTTALLLFQQKYNLPPTGRNDEATQAKLKELFAS
jgi:peptidoglycan hydrolase-like protein with peptidoglycan-binding domain